MIKVHVELSGEFKSSEITRFWPNAKVDWEMGEIGNIGRYKGQPLPRTIISIENNSEELGYSEQIDNILKEIWSKYMYLLQLNKYIEKILWLNYEYSEQCNLEFTPNQLKSMSQLDMTFCISCWENK